MERKWIIVAFGDIHGFGTWTSRAAGSREIKDPFIYEFFQLLQFYIKKYPNVHFKYQGDGFMAAKEFAFEKSHKEVVEFIKALQCITSNMKDLISKCKWPAPDGFRIRIASGYVYKLMVIDPNNHKNLIPEYIEYATNTAAHLLAVNPETTCLVTEGVAKAMGKFRSIFRMRKLKKPSYYPPSVNREDIQGLFIIKF